MIATILANLLRGIWEREKGRRRRKKRDFFKGNSIFFYMCLRLPGFRFHIAAEKFQLLPVSIPSGMVVSLSRSLTFIFLTLTSLQITNVIAADWKGCYPEGESSGKVFTGEKTPVCLVISDQASWEEETVYYRFLFTPNVDEFTKLDVQDCKYVLFSNKEKSPPDF